MYKTKILLLILTAFFSKISVIQSGGIEYLVKNWKLVLASSALVWQQTKINQQKKQLLQNSDLITGKIQLPRKFVPANNVNYAGLVHFKR